MADLELDARYQAYDGVIAFTPVLHFRTPITSYEEKGYAAAGTHLKAGDTIEAHAEHTQSLLPLMDAVRAAADTLEGVVADDLWPLPTYQEMLYIL